MLFSVVHLTQSRDLHFSKAAVVFTPAVDWEVKNKSIISGNRALIWP